MGLIRRPVRELVEKAKRYHRLKTLAAPGPWRVERDEEEREMLLDANGQDVLDYRMVHNRDFLYQVHDIADLALDMAYELERMYEALRCAHASMHDAIEAWKGASVTCSREGEAE